MSSLPKALLALLLISLLAAKIIIQRHDLIAIKEKNAALIQDQEKRDAFIQHLQETEASNRKRLAQLQSETRRITRTLAQRETLIGKRQHEDPQIQPWAATPLPDAIISLRQHAEATGATEYHPELPDAQSLLPATGEPAHQR